MFRLQHPKQSSLTSEAIDLFIDAARYGDNDAMQGYLNADAEILNATNAFGSTALIEAAKKNKENSVKFLLDLGADPTIVAANGYAAIHQACHLGCLEAARLIIEINSALVNSKASQNWTPLHFAVEGEYLEITKFLIQKGADVTAIALGSEGNEITPLNLAFNSEIRDVINSQISMPGMSVANVFSAKSLVESQNLSTRK